MGSKTGSGTGKGSSPANDAAAPARKGGWQEIEALREKKALKESLADVWDEDFDLDEEVLADLDHNAEFFTSQAADDEDFDEESEDDEFFDDDPV